MAGRPLRRLRRLRLNAEEGPQEARNRRNPKPHPDQPVEVTLRDERIDLSRVVRLAPGVNAAMQVTRTGTKSFLTHGEQRLFLYLQDDKGRGSYFYQSFSGTGGKQQGAWFPSGGIMADRQGRGVWVIKGSPRTDPGCGRVHLLELYEKVNEALPHSDRDTDVFVSQLTRSDYGDFVYADGFEIKPVIRILEPGHANALQTKWGPWVYQFWALNALDKTWGKRTFTPGR